MAASIIHRFKKLFILLCIIPIVTAGIAYFMEMGKETTYTASTMYELGNFENEKLTNAAVISDLYKTPKYIGDIIKSEDLNYSVDEIKSGIQIGEAGRNLIEFKYTSTNKEKAEEIVKSYSNYFSAVSTKKYNKKYEIVKRAIERVKLTEKTRGYLEREEPEFLSDKESTQENFRKTIEVKPVSVSTLSSNPLKKAIFGFLVGIMLSLFILLIPELFKEYRNEERI